MLNKSCLKYFYYLWASESYINPNTPIMKTTIYTFLLMMAFTTMGYSQTNQIIRSLDDATDHIQAIEKYNNMERQSVSNKQVLDSIIDRPNLQIPNNYFYPMKQYFLYNEYGKDTLHLFYYRQSNSGPWTISSKTRKFYDNKGRLTERREYTYVTNTNTWKSTYRDVYSYNNNDHITIWTTSNWDADSAKYLEIGMYTFDYDSHGNIIKKMNYYIDYQTNTLTPSLKTESTYIQNNLLTEAINSLMNPNTKVWELASKKVMDYTPNKLMNQQITLDWNLITLAWDSVSLLKYEYDTADYLTKTLWYKFKQNNWHQTNFTQRLYSVAYDTMDILGFGLDTNTMQMFLQWKSLVAFDQNHNQNVSTYYTRDTSNNVWIANYKDSANYDLNYTISDAIYPERAYYIYSANNLKINKTTFNYQSSNATWIMHNNTTYYFATKSITGINKASQESINVYPNPTSDYIHFDIPLNNQDAQIEVFDITGKLVYHASLGNDKKLSVNRFDKGLYLFRIVSQNKIFSGKFMVE